MIKNYYNLPATPIPIPTLPVGDALGGTMKTIGKICPHLKCHIFNMLH